MWHWTNEDTGKIISGDREYIKQQLNIFTVDYFDDNGNLAYDEIADIWNDYHWQKICKDYKIWGKD